MPVISSGVEESLDIFELDRDVSTSVDITNRLFATLTIYHDIAPHSAAANMAIDEALLESSTAPAIRFYRWKSPALSFGYFGRFADVAGNAPERDLVRRWTGGGMVFHGEDLTYSIVIPATEPLFGESSMSNYQKIHRALRDALLATGQRAVVAGGVDPVRTMIATRAATNDRGYACFANPVRADVLLNGRKIAGAAQRRTRRGLLHQGSIQDVHLDHGFARRFSQALSLKINMRDIGDRVWHRAQEIAQEKYGAEAWLRKH
jgi:lipoyl(octanoyl) transferase